MQCERASARAPLPLTTHKCIQRCDRNAVGGVSTISQCALRIIGYAPPLIVWAMYEGSIGGNHNISHLQRAKCMHNHKRKKRSKNKKNHRKKGKRRRQSGEWKSTAKSKPQYLCISSRINVGWEVVSACACAKMLSTLFWKCEKSSQSSVGIFMHMPGGKSCTHTHESHVHNEQCKHIKLHLHRHTLARPPSLYYTVYKYRRGQKRRWWRCQSFPWWFFSWPKFS